MTSDSEAEYKYSSSYNVPIKTEYPTTCPAGELRCVNGNCITISQLCDKVEYHFIDRYSVKFSVHLYNIVLFLFFLLIHLDRFDGTQVTDCPDGADEAMCVYQN